MFKAGRQTWGCKWGPRPSQHGSRRWTCWTWPKDFEKERSSDREACLNAALNMWDLQKMPEEGTRSYGQLGQERWKVRSMVIHDSLLASGILYFFLEDAMMKMVKKRQH